MHKTLIVVLACMMHNNYALMNTQHKPREYKKIFNSKLYLALENSLFGISIGLIGYGCFKLHKLVAIQKEHRLCDLRNAAHDLNLKKIEEFLAEGIDVNASDKEGNTPLIIATKQARYSVQHSLAVIKKLCQAGAELNTKNSEQRCALHYAVEAKATEIVLYLVSQRELDIHATDADGCTAFDMALALLEPPATTSEILRILSLRLIRENKYADAEKYVEHLKNYPVTQIKLAP